MATPDKSLPELVDEAVNKLEDVRKELKSLKTSRRWQWLTISLVTVSLVATIALGILGYINAQNDRDELRSVACHSAETAVQSGREANAIIVETFVAVLTDPNDPEDREIVQRVREQIASRQEETLALPICE